MFRSVFIAVVIAFALILGAFLINRARPKVETEQPTAALVRASGKCAECHLRTQYAVVHEYEMSMHAQKGVNCLDCHQPAPGQEKKDHHGFVISAKLTAGNCRSCHENIYQQFLRSRHAAPAWAAVYGEKGLTSEQVSFSETYQPGATRRPPNALAELEGVSAKASGCEQCHSVGKPNSDGTIGTCTACHTRHTSSVRIARLPSTCGQCHMGPDHSQIEIYEESRHGILFQSQERMLNLDAPPKTLTTRDMFVPTCATCHMSGINGLGVTHDPSERLSYYLANAITEKRPNYAMAQAKMKQVCSQCHTPALIDRVYTQAEEVVQSTNQRVQAAQDIVNGLRKDGVLTGPPFSQPIDFVYFNLWHYDGRTSKHGAFMGGADFVQWHGNYPMVEKTVELKAMAADLRREHGRGK
ncbi:MAG TPA: ammonia-forming cytochrome c nitrite reductase subunit c552 [Silvibacterium sp.]|nr:ammonia-forming cytochrome c nitrite reductase subunit c552 [Silvibacterium sp.]